MNQNIHINPILIVLTIWMLLCIFITRNVEAGGKGKGGRQGHIIIQNEVKGQNNLVPIYMPIPIPIPMPVGPSGGGPNHHHHHHQQHQNQRDEGEGEIKKIYLLQPMPKVQPPPQLKGGFPVQTHIHMPAPIMQHSQKTHRHTTHQHSHGGGGGHDNSGGGNNHHKQQQQQHQSSYSDMKILPIVVIPPIAPMPPIHVAGGGGNSNSHAPRMTLTPQFNNYVVSSSSEPGLKSSKIGHHLSSMSSGGYPQDDKSFSDYVSGLGSSVRRGGNFKPRARSIQMRHSGAGSGRQMGIHRSASRNRPSRYEDQRYYDGEEMVGDSDDLIDLPPRRSAYQPRGRRLSSSNRYRSSYQDQPVEQRGRVSNSIRDIINEQASLFDEEQPPYSIDGGSSLTSGEPASRSSKQLVDCCNENSRVRQHSSIRDAIAEAQLKSNTEQREVSALIDRDYMDQIVNRPRNQDLPADEILDSPKPELRQRQVESLNNAYYDRDLLDDSLELRQPSTSHNLGGSGSRLDVNGRKLYLDEREVLDEDQWLFDTIKSVSHVSPNTNANNATTTVKKSTIGVVSSKLNATTTLNSETKSN